MTIRKLKNMPYTQAKVEIDDNNNIALISYTTTVCIIGKDGWLTCYGTYSNTTRRHISAFMKEYGNGATYYTAKKCYEERLAYNIHNGRFMDGMTGELLNL